MAFACTYAGIPFQLPTAEVRQVLERCHWFADLRDVSTDPQVWPGARLLKVGPTIPRECPPPRIHEYFYPIGASRWSIYRGLATAENVADMPATGTFVIQIDSTPSPEEQSTTSTTTSVTTTLSMLPPVPIFGVDEPQLYLVTLVDERYFWHQWQNAGVITCTSATATWSDLLEHLANQLDITLNFTTPSGAYGSPEPDSALYSNYESPAVLLDAVAANVGCVVVRNLGTLEGTYSLQTYADAAAALEDNRSDTTIMGGLAFDFLDSTTPTLDTPNVMPESVTVVFPRWLDGAGYIEPTTYRSTVKDSYGETWSYEVALSSLGTPYSGYEAFSGSKVLRTTAKARFTESTDPTPNNATTVEALAQQLAKDYYDSRSAWLQEAYPAILAWTPEGISDLIWSGNGWTKTLPPPFNAGLSEFQHGFGPLTPALPLTVQDDKGNSATTWLIELANATLSSTTGGDKWTPDLASATTAGIVCLNAVVSEQVIGTGTKTFDEIGIFTNGSDRTKTNANDILIAGSGISFNCGLTVTPRTTASSAQPVLNLESGTKDAWIINGFGGSLIPLYFSGSSAPIDGVTIGTPLDSTGLGGTFCVFYNLGTGIPSAQHGDDFAIVNSNGFWATNGYNVSPQFNPAWSSVLEGKYGTDAIGNEFTGGIVTTIATGIPSMDYGTW